jgi:hypothetical protein
MYSMLVCNYVVSVVFLALGGAMMYGAAAFPMAMTEQGPGPGFWPFCLGAVLVAASLILFLFSLFHREDMAAKQVAFTMESNRPVYKAMGLLVLLCAAIVVLGFFPALVIFIPALMYLLRCRNLRWIGGTTLGVIVFVYVVFGMVLNTQFPQSIFLE